MSDYENIFSETTFTKNFAIIKVLCIPTRLTSIVTIRCNPLLGIENTGIVASDEGTIIIITQ